MDPDNTPTGLPHDRPDQSLLKESMANHAMDRCMVFNPLNVPYTLYWNSYGYSVAPKQKWVTERYKAEKFAKEVVDMILTYKYDKYIAQINKERINKGFGKLDPQEEERIGLSEDFRINNPAIRLSWMKQIWLGTTEYFAPPRRSYPKPGMQRTEEVPLDQRLIQQLDKLAELSAGVDGSAILEIEAKPMEQPAFAQEKPTGDLIDIPIDEAQVNELSKEKVIQDQKEVIMDLEINGPEQKEVSDILPPEEPPLYIGKKWRDKKDD